MSKEYLKGKKARLDRTSKVRNLYQNCVQKNLVKIPCDLVSNLLCDNHFVLYLGGIPLENFGYDPIELEGTLVFENSDCNSCHDNATIQIKITPKRENVDLELHLDRSFGPVLENFGFSIAPFFMGNKLI